MNGNWDRRFLIWATQELHFVGFRNDISLWKCLKIIDDTFSRIRYNRKSGCHPGLWGTNNAGVWLEGCYFSLSTIPDPGILPSFFGKKPLPAGWQGDDNSPWMNERKLRQEIPDMGDAGTHFVSFRNDISFDGIERLLIFSPTTSIPIPNTHYQIPDTRY